MILLLHSIWIFNANSIHFIYFTLIKFMKFVFEVLIYKKLIILNSIYIFINEEYKKIVKFNSLRK